MDRNVIASPRHGNRDLCPAPVRRALRGAHRGRAAGRHPRAARRGRRGRPLARGRRPAGADGRRGRVRSRPGARASRALGPLDVGRRRRAGRRRARGDRPARDPAHLERRRVRAGHHRVRAVGDGGARARDVRLPPGAARGPLGQPVRALRRRAARPAARHRRLRRDRPPPGDRRQGARDGGVGHAPHPDAHDRRAARPLAARRRARRAAAGMRLHRRGGVARPRRPRPARPRRARARPSRRVRGQRRSRKPGRRGRAGRGDPLRTRRRGRARRRAAGAAARGQPAVVRAGDPADAASVRRHARGPGPRGRRLRREPAAVPRRLGPPSSRTASRWAEATRPMPTHPTDHARRCA